MLANSAKTASFYFGSGGIFFNLGMIISRASKTLV
jgi:hypothetical protein